MTNKFTTISFLIILFLCITIDMKCNEVPSKDKFKKKNCIINKNINPNYFYYLKQISIDTIESQHNSQKYSYHINFSNYQDFFFSFEGKYTDIYDAIIGDILRAIKTTNSIPQSDESGIDQFLNIINDDELNEKDFDMVNFIGCCYKKTNKLSKKEGSIENLNRSILLDGFLPTYIGHIIRSIEIHTSDELLNDYKSAIFKLIVDNRYFSEEKLNNQINLWYESESDSSYRNNLESIILNKAGIYPEYDDLVQLTYQRMQYDLRASHILIRIDPPYLPEDTIEAYNKIIDSRNRVLNGESFAEIAMEISDDPSVKKNSGDLGYFSVFNMVYPFESVAYSTEIGEISMPFKTEFGYHITKVTDKIPPLGEIEISHLFLAIPSNATKEDSIAIQVRIDSIYALLSDNSVFEDLATMFSEDPASAKEGGILPAFTCNRMVPEFIVTISALNQSNPISEPILTSYGWHIIKFINKTGIKPYGEAYWEILHKIMNSDYGGIIED